MLLTRSLPPQFLLPAWSAPQLAQAVQQKPRKLYGDIHRRSSGNAPSVGKIKYTKVGKKLRNEGDYKPWRGEWAMKFTPDRPQEELSGHHIGPPPMKAPDSNIIEGRAAELSSKDKNQFRQPHSSDHEDTSSSKYHITWGQKAVGRDDLYRVPFLRRKEPALGETPRRTLPPSNDAKAGGDQNLSSPSRNDSLPSFRQPSKHGLSKPLEEGYKEVDSLLQELDLTNSKTPQHDLGLSSRGYQELGPSNDNYLRAEEGVDAECLLSSPFNSKSGPTGGPETKPASRRVAGRAAGEADECVTLQSPDINDLPTLQLEPEQEASELSNSLDSAVILQRKSSKTPKSKRSKPNSDVAHSTRFIRRATSMPSRDSAGEVLSLFDDLFPDEQKVRAREAKLAEKRLEKLPAFNWTPELYDVNDESQQRDSMNARGDVIPPREAAPEARTQFLGRLNLGAREKIPSRTDIADVSVLVFNVATRLLEESDFFRVGGKGEHIEGWTSGILKVILARDPITLEPTGRHFVVFANSASAQAYLDQVMRLHRLSRLSGISGNQWVSPLPLGVLKEGEEAKSLLRGYSLVPGFIRLSLRLLPRPYSQGLRSLLRNGGVPSLSSRQARGEHLVLFSTDRGHVKFWDLANALGEDGRRRNLVWMLAGNYTEAIDMVKDGKDGNHGDEEVERTNQHRYEGPAKYTIAFKDSHEARRFVMEWHRRPFPISQKNSEDGEAAPLVNAHLLW